MLNYGILSIATIIDRFVAGIRETKDGYVKAIASRHIDKAKDAAKRLNIDTYYGSYQELFEDESIDIIYIPTINSSHYYDCKNALLHHKHVIMEKPFTLTTLQAEELFRLARENHCFLMEGQKSVFLPVSKKVKELINQNIIGDIKYIEYKAAFPCEYKEGYWMYDLSLGGGCLYGSASYTIESLLYFFDKPKLSIGGHCIRHHSGIDTLVHICLDINKKISCSSTIIMNSSLKNEAVIYGEKGYIEIPYYWKARDFSVHYNDGQIENYHFDYQSEFRFEIEHAHDCIHKGLIESPIMSFWHTYECVKLVEELQNKLK